MKKLVARVVVVVVAVLLACIWTGPVAGWQTTLPSLENATVLLRLSLPWEFKGLPTVTTFKVFSCDSCDEAQYARVVEGLMCNSFEMPLTQETLELLTRSTLLNNLLIPIAHFNFPEGRKLVIPVLEGMKDLDEVLHIPIRVNGLVSVSVKEQREIARALLKPLTRMHAYHSYHGDVKLKNIVAVPTNTDSSSDPQEGWADFKVLKRGTQLLLKDCHSTGAVDKVADRFDAFTLAMTFGDMEIGSAITELMLAEKTSIATDLQLLALYGEVGRFNGQCSFWQDVKFEQMEPDMQSMWMFTMLAVLPRGSLTFEQMGNYLNGNAGMGEDFLNELRRYARMLAYDETDWVQGLLSFSAKGGKQVIDSVAVRLYNLPNDVLNLASINQAVAKEIKKILKYALSFTFMFPPVADKWQTIEVTVDALWLKRWKGYLDTLDSTDRDRLAQYICVKARD
eukprot:GHVS01101528.1.p1 GENE.GHVS01101528.1~~GHVS01101528.1.p1  ORF type:complete len:452 (-),score=29.52 GHVS01101528.1:82-1437(-)